MDDARSHASAARQKIHQGVDPIDQRKAAVAKVRAEQVKSVRFGWCAEQYIESHRAGWRNAKHAEQWSKTLKDYAGPVIGGLRVDQIDTAHIMKILQPMWNEKPETASRLRGRIENVLDWAKVHQYRSGENPARCKGHLDKLLPARSKVKKEQHHAAQPWQDMSSLMTKLRQQEGMGARAVEFVVYTAARSGEVRGARWAEIDFKNVAWRVPADRMKAGKEHRVPLSAAAILVLSEARKLTPDCEFIFPGPSGKPLSDMTLTKVLRRMEYAEVTVHGFRSSFRDWAAEATEYPSDLVEMALAHTISSKVEAAYRRGDMIEKRLALMEDWAKHCNTAKT